MHILAGIYKQLNTVVSDMVELQYKPARNEIDNLICGKVYIEWTKMDSLMWQCETMNRFRIDKCFTCLVKSIFQMLLSQVLKCM